MNGRIFLCLLGLHKWCKPRHVIISDSSVSYHQLCTRPGCGHWRVAPRKLWGPVFPEMGVGQLQAQEAAAVKRARETGQPIDDDYEIRT
jgi:hypothetical protein